MRFRASLVLGLITALLVRHPAMAEVHEVHVATQYGFGFLPMMVMEHEHLFEKRLMAAGEPDVAVRWLVLGGGTAMNDALLSGSLDLASGGVAPFILLWSRAKGRSEVRAISALATVPLWFNTRDPEVKSLEDLTDRDKIAVTAPTVSVHAILLEIAASKRWGLKDYAHYDALEFALPQPDSTAALLSGAVNNHFSAPPFQYAEVRQPGIRTITTAEAILGGPATFIVTWTTGKFRAENPVAYQAFLSATDDAVDLINRDLRVAAGIYLAMSHDKLSEDELLAMLRDPGTRFTTTPQNVMTYANYMYEFGTIKTKPASWKALFFPEVHGRDGS